MNYTNATIIIAAADQAAAQADFPGSFSSQFTDGAQTFYVCSGLWSDDDLARIVNDVAWPHKVFFDDVHATLSALQLQPIEDAEPSTEPV